MAYTSEIVGSEPVKMVDVKAHLRVTYGEDDSMIYTMLQTAREWAETHTEKAIVDQIVTAYYPGLKDKMVLPIGNARSITSVKYLDGNKTQQTLTAGFIVTKGTPNTLVFVDTVPEFTEQADSVEVEYVAGYDCDYPSRIKSALLLLVGDMYEHREAQVVKDRVEQNPTLERLLFPVREVGM
jgi:uncharacterized phiE125 gp8 family phage protein